MNPWHERNVASLKKRFPHLPGDQLEGIAATIKTNSEDPAYPMNDQESYRVAHAAATKASVDHLYPAVDMAPIQAKSDAQRDFAEKVRVKHVQAIRGKLAQLETTIASARADGDGGSFVDRTVEAQKELAKWLSRLAAAKDANKILDTKDNDFAAAVSPRIADVLAKKLGVTL